MAPLVAEPIAGATKPLSPKPGKGLRYQPPVLQLIHGQRYSRAMAPQSSGSEAERAGVARLTAKERECLDRWLDHATAKEIALDLGISHHAVEKRLKSARQKLGVATTLDAARLLAVAQGYGRTAYRAPEVAAPPAADDVPAAGLLAATAQPASEDRQRWIIAGVTIMSLAVLAAAALSTSGAPEQAAADPSRTPEIVVVNGGPGKPGELDGALARVFGGLDKNGNGQLDGDELTGVTRTRELELGLERSIAGQRTSSAAPAH